MTITQTEIEILKNVLNIDDLSDTIKIFQNNLLDKELKKKGTILLTITNQHTKETYKVAAIACIDNLFAYFKTPFAKGYSLVHIKTTLNLTTSTNKRDILRAVKYLQDTLPDDAIDIIRVNTEKGKNPLDNLTQEHKKILLNTIYIAKGETIRE